MELCSDGHKEICYTNRECPLCVAISLIAELEIKVGRLEAELNDLGV